MSTVIPILTRMIMNTITTMLIILINICIIRTALLSFIVPRWQDIRGVAAAYPITWALTAVCMLLYYLRYHKMGKESPTDRGRKTRKMNESTQQTASAVLKELQSYWTDRSPSYSAQNVAEMNNWKRMA